jgi:hypothetical protein
MKLQARACFFHGQHLAIAGRGRPHTHPPAAAPAAAGPEHPPTCPRVDSRRHAGACVAAPRSLAPAAGARHFERNLLLGGPSRSPPGPWAGAPPPRHWRCCTADLLKLAWPRPARLAPSCAQQAWTVAMSSPEPALPSTVEGPRPSSLPPPGPEPLSTALTSKPPHARTCADA